MDKPVRKHTFEEAMTRLDEIVAAMESGEIGIEDSVARYEEAMKLASHCRRILENVEQRIEKVQLSDSGEPRVSPFDNGDSADAAADPSEADDDGSA